MYLYEIRVAAEKVVVKTFCGIAYFYGNFRIMLCKPRRKRLAYGPVPDYSDGEHTYFLMRRPLDE